MMGRNMPRFLALMLGVCITVSGCGLGKGGNSDNKNSGKDGAKVEAAIPEVHQYDSGMGMAHYISAPSFDSLEDVAGTDSEGSDNSAGGNDSTGITHYEISYRMTVDNTSACFVIGDKTGEYGELILCELTDHGAGGSSDENGASLTMKRFYNGAWDQSYDAKVVELPIQESTQHVYDVLLEVQGKSLLATVNGEPAGAWTIPGFELGCVGTYKSRGTSYAYIDDVNVSSDGETLFKDDFDGDFENNLFEYNYATEAISAFSPYYVKLTGDDANKQLRVSPGFILSEAAAEPTPVFRREFLCEKKELKHAYLYLTALGSFEARINDELVSDHFFDPGKMVYDRYLNYVSYDVTDLIQDQNALDITLFHGFFDRGSGYPEVAGIWGRKRAIKGDLVLVYNDESSEIITTDGEFKVTIDPRYRFDDIYQGEIIDDRYSIDPEQTWQDVLVDDVDENLRYIGVETKTNESVKPIEIRDYVSVSEPVEGHFVYDFGQNFAGTISFNLKDFAAEELKEGQVITFRYGELLNAPEMVNADGDPGTVWTQNLFTARATDYYICGEKSGENPKGGNAEYGGVEDGVTFAHTYHGFRYLEITGLDKAISAENIKALVLSSGIEETGTFECSSDIINRFYNNSRYSMRSNFMDVPTDCPQRDERLGWTGDAQATSLFGMYQYDSKDFYESYMKAMRNQQDSNGAYPDVAPTNSRFGGHNCWGDAPVVIAWNLYLQYGDLEALKNDFWGLGDWIDYLVEASDNYLMTSGGYGDHLSSQDTIETLTDTAWCAHSARLVSNMAKILGKSDDARKYMEIADAFKEAWQNAYIREDSSVEAGILIAEAESETAYSLGIAFDLFPEEMMDGAKERLKILTEYGGLLFYPGYSGMSYYLPALVSGGYADTAVKVLENTSLGGIAFPLIMGLTTNPEELRAFKYHDEAGNIYENGRYRVTGSLNHAAYAAVCSFLYTDILGIKSDEDAPGFEHFFIEPAVNCGLSHASGSYKCIHGTISVSWNADEKKLTATVPEGTTCTIILPGTTTEAEPGDYEIGWE